MSNIYGQEEINALIELAVCSDGYSSEAELARALNIVPQKLNRWKNGKSAVSSEGVLLCRILLNLGTASRIKSFLKGRSGSARLEVALNDLEKSTEIDNSLVERFLALSDSYDSEFEMLDQSLQLLKRYTKIQKRISKHLGLD